MDKWDYMISNVSNSDRLIAKELKYLGERGWELVNITLVEQMVKLVLKKRMD